MTKLIYNDDFDIEHHPITERIQAKADEIGALFNLPEGVTAYYEATSHGTIFSFPLESFLVIATPALLYEDSHFLKIARLCVRQFRIEGDVKGKHLGDNELISRDGKRTYRFCTFHFGHDLTPDWEVSAQKEANKHTGEPQDAKQ